MGNLQDFAGNDRAFAAVLTDGSVLSWGDPKTGGDNKELQETIECILGSRVPTPYEPSSEKSTGESGDSDTSDVSDGLKEHGGTVTRTTEARSAACPLPPRTMSGI